VPRLIVEARCHNGRVDRSVAVRASLIQGGSLAALAVALAVALPRSFFEDWGWAAGPGVWAVCAGIVAIALRLPMAPVLAGAAVAGLASLIGVVSGVHWAGAPLGVILFGLWCGRLAIDVRASQAAAG
jgi:hypothetical protein